MHFVIARGDHYINNYYAKGTVMHITVCNF